MAAKKKSGALHVLLVVGAVIAVLYISAKVLPAIVASLRGGSSAGSIGGGGGVSGEPYDPYEDQQDDSGDLIGSLLNGLGNLFGKLTGGKSGGGSSIGSGGGSGSGGGFGSGSSTGGILSDIFSPTQFGWEDNPDLGGASLFDYVVDPSADSGLSGYQIPEAPGAVIGDQDQFLNVTDYNPPNDYGFDDTGYADVYDDPTPIDLGD